MGKIKFMAVAAAMLLTVTFTACGSLRKVDLVAVEEKSATCTEDGNAAYWYDQAHDKYYSDETGKKEISAESIVLPATGHDWDEGTEMKAAECVEEGEMLYTCKVCGETKTEAIPTLSGDGVHHWEDNVCTVCGYDAGGSKGLSYTFDEEENVYTVAGIGTCADAYVEIPAVYNGAAVTAIAENAFQNCRQLKGITIPESVTLIGNGTVTSKGAFNGCGNLETMVLPFVGQSADITSAGQRALFGFIFGSISYEGGRSTKQYYKEGNYGTYYIPTSLRSITVTGGDVFYGAFYGCSQLESITLNDSVTIAGGRAFDGCTALTAITIGRGVTNIPNNTFNNCTSLQTVYYTGTEEEYQAITVGVTNNGVFTKATVYYNGEW